MSDLEVDLRALGVPEALYEYRFHDTRKWRFDMAWPDRKLAVEIDGATWKGGRHVTGRGHQSDAEKRNAAVLLGWRVLTYSTSMLDNAAEQIAEAWNHDRP
jgi:very-short-patch-repair endonuclease